MFYCVSLICTFFKLSMSKKMNVGETYLFCVKKDFYFFKDDMITSYSLYLYYVINTYLPLIHVHCRCFFMYTHLVKHTIGNIFKCSMLCSTSDISNRIGGVMVNVLASSAVDRGFEPWTVKNQRL